MRISLQNVAAKLGLSRSTVCRALQNNPKISLKTRKRIQAACQELDYRPSAVISELASLRWRRDTIKQETLIAYIDCIRPGSNVSRLDASSFRKHASTLGYQLEVFRRADFASSAKLQRVLRNRGITDVIVGPIVEKEFMVDLDWDKFIAVQVWPGFFRLPLHGVVRDHFNAIVLNWRKAVAYGYRRIGITLLDHSEAVMDDVLRASAVHACQTHLFPNIRSIPAFHFPGGRFFYKGFKKWVKLHKPDVIIGFNDGFHDLLRAEFGQTIAYCALSVESTKISGSYNAVGSSEKEGINLIHFCRRTHQWGIPQERIDHVLEPTWNEGSSMPRKGTQ